MEHPTLMKMAEFAGEKDAHEATIQYITDKLSFLKKGEKVLILFYVIYFVAEYMGLRFLYSFTPLEYFNIYDLMTNGFSGLFLFLTALITVLCIGVAIERWRKKDF